VFGYLECVVLLTFFSLTNVRGVFPCATRARGERSEPCINMALRAAASGASRVSIQAGFERRARSARRYARETLALACMDAFCEHLEQNAKGYVFSIHIVYTKCCYVVVVNNKWGVKSFLRNSSFLAK